MTGQYLDKNKINAGLVEHVDAFADAEFSAKPVKHYAADIRVGDTGSLSIKRDGRWHSFRDSKGGGDLIGLIMWHRNVEFREALEHGAAFLEGKEITGVSVTGAARGRGHDEEGEANIERALYHWQRGTDITGTLAEDYLIKTRRIPIIPEYARRKLRYVNKLWHHRTESHHPALIAKVQQPDSDFAGIFRIYLDPATKDKITDSPKMRLGSVEGAAIRLSRTAEEIIICEGVEDALTILAACPDKSVWCGIGGNMRSVVFPPQVKRIVIAADNDPAGEGHARALAHRLVSEGRTVSICRPTITKDFNDIAKG